MVENLTPQLGEFFGVKNGGGVLVRSVEKGSRAEKAGIRAGDVVVRVDKEGVQDTSDFTRALRARGGNSVTLGILRDKREQTLTLTLPERKESGALLDGENESVEMPDIDVEAFDGLEDIQTQVARIQPQVQIAIEKSRRMVEKSAEDCANAAVIEEQREEIQKQSDDMKEELEEQREEMIEQQQDLQEENIQLRFSQQLPI
jgi:membrane-associated protease RseP (regulator of RpoE activity)